MCNRQQPGYTALLPQQIESVRRSRQDGEVGGSRDKGAKAKGDGCKRKGESETEVGGVVRRSCS